MEETKLKQLIKGSGLILRKPKSTDALYDVIFFGEIAKPINWEQWLPTKEFQQLPFCVTYSRLNCAETMSRKTGEELNFSDRFLGVISGTTQRGNSCDNVSDWFRNKGTPLEKDCPWTTTDWAKVFNLSDVPPNVRLYKGGNYSWLKTDIQSLKNALAFGPIQLGIGCGETYYDSVVIPPKNTYSYHAVTCYWIDDKYIYIYDSVQQPFKKLSINYPIQCAMSFRDLPDNWRDIQFMAKLERKKGDVKVFLTINGERYWIKEAVDFENLKTDQPITNIQWEQIKEVDGFVTPYNGKIIGSVNFIDILKQLFGRVK